MRKKSGYDKATSDYIDITTGRHYQPKEYCELCKFSSANVTLTVHHFLPQSKCQEDLKSKVKFPKTWTQEFINENQKLFTLCTNCHSIVHYSPKILKEKFGYEQKDWIWVDEKTKVVTKPTGFIWKKGNSRF